MEYFFIPGRLRDLSIAEIKALFTLHPKYEFTLNRKPHGYFTVRTDAPEEVLESIFKRSGGYIKYGKIVDASEESYLESKVGDGEDLLFGVSYYPYKKAKDHNGKGIVNKFASTLKTYFKSKGVKSRFIGGDKAKLSSGSIIQNELLDKGFEIVLLEQPDGEALAGETLEIQDVEGYVERDYDKPSSDKEMGMLPPKLARIMLNLSGASKGATIWDPFCGSGVILLEALLMGMNVVGSDISGEAVASTEDNIAWLASKYDLGDLKYHALVHDIKRENFRLTKDLKLTGIDAVVFEPYMGPPQRKKMSPIRAEKLLTEVSELLGAAFEQFEKIGQPGMTVVAVVPSYLTHNGWATPRYTEFLSKKWNILNSKMKEKDLHWSRSNSIITRNILIAQLRRR